MIGVINALMKLSGFPGESTGVCQSQNCLVTAAAILHDIDTSVDPCTDFYQYSCGGWMKMHEIADDESQTGTFDAISDEIEDIIKQILEHSYSDLKTIGGNFTVLPEIEKKDEQVFNKAKHYYESCINEQVIDSRGATPFYPVLKQFNALWKDSPGDTRQTVTTALAYLISNGVYPLFSFYGDADSKIPGVNTLYLTQNGLGLPSKQYYEVEANLQLYQDVMLDTWNALFKDNDIMVFDPDTDINSAVKSVLKFEKTLASVSNSTDELRDPVASYNPMTIQDLNEAIPSIDWNLMVSKLQVSNVTVERMIVESPMYLQNVGRLIAETDIMTIRYHFTNALIFAVVDSLSKTIRGPNNRLSATLNGNKVAPVRWKTCVRAIGDVFGQLVGRYYALVEFGTDAQSYADAFLHTVRDSLKQRLTALDFLDDVTRQRALAKLHKIVQKVGYSKSDPDVMSPKSLAMYYEGILAFSDKYFENHLSYLKWDSKYNWALYGQPVNRLKWGMNAQDVNAYYNPLLNEIVFPAGILQAPFFDLDYPSCMNYGGIGAVMGHELTHAFDDSGRQYDEDGRIASWWTNDTEAKFNERAQCFVKQYSSFTVTGANNQSISVNGKLTLGENLADNGGVLIAYNAWRNTLNTTTVDQPKNYETLPGLEKFSPEQLFFINFGRVWCQKITAEKSIKRIYTDPHSPDRWRVNGVSQNSEEFAKAFKCPPRATMNPENKCHLW